MEPVLCYNRGCGKTYHPKDNEKEEGKKSAASILRTYLKMKAV